ncbi:hypothetical protein GCM10027589_29320 [Actinocorallia lasiicapitis]
MAKDPAGNPAMSTIDLSADAALTRGRLGCTECKSEPTDLPRLPANGNAVSGRAPGGGSDRYDALHLINRACTGQ